MARERDVMELRDRLARLREADERRWGKMCAGEMVWHVREAFRLALGDRPPVRRSSTMPRRVMKLFALHLPLPWPHGVATVPELERVHARTEEFAVDRAGLLDAMERFARRRENRTEHPILGRMTPSDWMRWGYLHTDHHLRQFGR